MQEFADKGDVDATVVAHLKVRGPYRQAGLCMGSIRSRQPHSLVDRDRGSPSLAGWAIPAALCGCWWQWQLGHRLQCVHVAWVKHRLRLAAVLEAASHRQGKQQSKLAGWATCLGCFILLCGLDVTVRARGHRLQNMET